MRPKEPGYISLSSISIASAEADFVARIEGYLGYSKFDIGSGSLDIDRVGFESELYFERLTIGLNAGYQSTDGNDDANIDALFAFYPMERMRLDFRAGVVGVDNGTPLVAFGLGGEFLFSDIMAPFIRWEASVPDDFGDIIQHCIVAGLTLRWGAETSTVLNDDRRYFKPSCGGVLLIGRIC